MSSRHALHTLLKSVTPLHTGLTISDVADQLLQPEHKALLSMPVVDEQHRPLGLISRYRLQDIFMQRFGRDLWGNRPLTEVVNSQSLNILVDSPLDDAARQVTEHLQYPITEDFILVNQQGHYLGLATVMDLLKAMQIRIDQRNHSLRQAMTELRNSQAHLVQSEKMASLGQMVAGVAHELNTPLGYVRNNVQLLDELLQPILALTAAQTQLSTRLTDKNSHPEQIQQALLVIEQAHQEAMPEQFAEDVRPLIEDTLYGIDQIAELAVGLKDFARLDRAMTDAVDLNECIRSTLVIARNNIKDKAEVSLRLEPLPSITCTPSQINQVLLNMLNNAAQAMERPGRILIRSWADQEQAHISIEDNGCGMPKAVQQRIFDPFFTTKAVGQGTGLGLSISYKIIQQHGGKIRLVSEPGRGTRFLISLPLIQTEALQRSA